MVRVLALLVLSGFLAGSVFAAPFSDGSPVRNGFIPERLDRIATAVNEVVEQGKIPGAVAIIARNGRVTYHESFGYADIVSKKPMTNDAIFRIASMSKAITSVGVMILYERGKFQLNDPVAKYLPEFANPQVISETDADGNITATVPAQKPIRIVDLLSHSSGISYSFVGSKLSKSYIEAGIIDGPTSLDYKLSEQMALLAQQPLLFEPGSAFTYGLSTDVLGYLIEVVSGKTLAQFIADEITGPLKMRDTAFYLSAEQADRLVTIYTEVPDKGLVAAKETELPITVGSADFPVEGAHSYYSGGAGLSSTAYDYARFIQMLLNNGELEGVRVLSRKSVELMHTPRIDWDGDGVADFGLGFQVLGDIGKEGELGSRGIFSWGGAFYTSYWIDPVENLVAVFMSQGRPMNTDIDNRFRTLVYQSLK